MTRRWTVVTAVVAAVAVALSVVLAMVAADRSDLEDELDERQAVAGIAGEFATAVAQFDHADLDAGRRRVQALATEGFEAEYEAALSGELRTRLLEGEVVIEPVVQEVFVGSIGGAQATAVVELDLSYTTTEGTFDVTGNFLLLNLVRTPDGWRVEGVENIRTGVDTRVTGLLEGLEGEAGGGGEAPDEPPG